MELFSYQVEGIDFLSSHDRAWLLDDMGLGKTVQYIRATEKLLDSGEVLIVCPNSLKYNIANEIEKWSEKPHSTFILDGPMSDRYFLTEAFFHLKERKIRYLISNYDMYARLEPQNKKKQNRPQLNVDLYKKLLYPWDIVHLDEVHKLKGRESESTHTMYGVTKKAHKLYMYTGTPLQNNMSELFPLLKITFPNEFSSYDIFSRRYCEVHFTEWGRKVVDITDKSHPKIIRLKERLDEFTLRRTKRQVLPDLPPKTVQQIPIYLEGNQLKQYLDMERDFLVQLESGELISAMMIIAQIIRLKQIAVSTDLLDKSSTKLRGAKVDATLELINSTDRQLIIFSQFRNVIDRLYDLIPRDVCKITGEVKVAERQKLVESFQAGNVRILLGVTPAIYQGFTLTAASEAIFIDKMWSPFINLQAQDRLLRIGQKNAVTIYELIVKNSIEEKIEEALRYKEEVFNTLFDSDDIPTSEIDFIHLIKSLYK